MIFHLRWLGFNSSSRLVEKRCAYWNCIQNAIKCNGNGFFAWLIHFCSNQIPIGFQNIQLLFIDSIILFMNHCKRTNGCGAGAHIFGFWNPKAINALHQTKGNRIWVVKHILLCIVHRALALTLFDMVMKPSPLYSHLPFLYFHNVTAWSTINSIVLIVRMAFQSIYSIVHLIVVCCCECRDWIMNHIRTIDFGTYLPFIQYLFRVLAHIELCWPQGTVVVRSNHNSPRVDDHQLRFHKRMELLMSRWNIWSNVSN